MQNIINLLGIGPFKTPLTRFPNLVNHQTFPNPTREVSETCTKPLIADKFKFYLTTHIQ